MGRVVVLPEVFIASASRSDPSRAAREAAKLECARLIRAEIESKEAMPEARTPIFSYSHLPGVTWCAATRNASTIGIDAAHSDEFEPGYPLHKVFHPSELELAPPACLWAIKEAVVKAMGCGWNAKNPLDIRISREMQVEGFAVNVFRSGETWVAVAT